MLVDSNKKNKINTNNYITLTEATGYCSYSQEYLSLRARQGKLKAVKVGRNWKTRKDWVEEYERENFVDELQQEIEIQEDYITLSEATKYCSYSQEYLSLRARQGKLKAVKIDKVWNTTKKWIEEYETENLDYEIKSNPFISENDLIDVNTNSTGNDLCVKNYVKYSPNLFDAFLTQINFFDFSKLKIDFKNFIELSRNIFSDFYSYLSNKNFTSIFREKRIPKFESTNKYSLDQVLRSANFSIAIILLFLIAKTISPFAINFYEANAKLIKKPLSIAMDKLLGSYKNNLDNVFVELNSFNKNLLDNYKNIPENISIAKVIFENNILSYKNNFVDSNAISEEINFSKIILVNKGLLSYNNFFVPSIEKNIKNSKTKVLGVSESVFDSSNNFSQEIKSDVVTRKVSKFLFTLNNYRNLPKEISKRIAIKSEDSNLAFWKNVLGAVKDVLGIGDTQYVYNFSNNKNNQESLSASNSNVTQNYYINKTGEIIKVETIKIVEQNGIRGEKGVKGDKGDQGVAGEKGDIGETGPRGLAGSGGGSTTIVQGGDAYLNENNRWTGTNNFISQVLVTDLGVARYLSTANLSVADSLSVQSIEDGGITVNGNTAFNASVVFNDLVNFNSGINLSGNLSVGDINSTGTSTLTDLIVLGNSDFSNLLADNLTIYNLSILATTTVTNLSVSDGVNIASGIPMTTTSTLYNIGGTLYWDGEPVGSSGVASSSEITGDFEVHGVSTLATTTIAELTFANATGTNLYISNLINTPSGNSNNWNTAYNWGDHSSVGYLTVESDPIWNSASTSLTVSNFASSNIS
ncbi:MAG: hypothetical protein PHZ07_03880, partial [Patescibacteria group bacterium]|nr:hypothetical protein [Patescibacteria group bacterium]